jgi:hypothetical protein
MRRFRNLPFLVLRLAFACLEEVLVRRPTIFPYALVVLPELIVSSHASLVLLLSSKLMIFPFSTTI